MTRQEKAKIILETLDECIQVDWNFEDIYLKGIVNGLVEIEKIEEGDSDVQKDIK